MPYNFDWSVKDDASANDYGHQEQSDGQVVTGSYRVLLPDGRTQVVNYRVEGDSGFVADVTYEGVAKAYEQPAPIYTPQNGADVYGPQTGQASASYNTPTSVSSAYGQSSVASSSTSASGYNPGPISSPGTGYNSGPISSTSSGYKQQGDISYVVPSVGTAAVDDSYLPPPTSSGNGYSQAIFTSDYQATKINGQQGSSYAVPSVLAPLVEDFVTSFAGSDVGPFPLNPPVYPADNALGAIRPRPSTSWKF